MNKHEQFIQLLSIYDDLNETDRAQVDAHVAECAECAANLAAYQAMDMRLQQLPRLQPDPSLRQDFYTQMESNMTSYKRNKQIRRLPAFAIQIFVIGALILLGVGFWINLRSNEVPVSAPITEPIQTENETPYFILKDYSLAHKIYQPGDPVQVEVVWDELWATGKEQVELLLVDTNGEHIAQSDTPLTEGRWSQSQVTYELTLPDDIENGRYLMHLSVTDQETGERIPIPSETVFVPQLVYVGEDFVPKPVSEAPVIRLESWSPNGKYLAFREYTEAEIRNGDVGTQRIYDVESGEYCYHAIDVRPGNVESWFAWVGDEAFAYLSASGRLVMRPACDLSMTYVTQQTAGEKESILAQSNDFNTLLIASTEGYSLDNPVYSTYTPLADFPDDLIVMAATFSPNDQVLAIVDAVGSVWLVNTETGRPFQTIPWQLEGHLPDPIWLSDDLLLARSMKLPEEHALMTLPANPDLEAQPRPFLLSLDGTTTPLETLFGEPIDETQQRIIAAPDFEQDSYTILLVQDPDKDERAPIRVYHSAIDEVETLKQEEIWGGGITGNGRYLLVVQSYAEGHAMLEGTMGEDEEPLDFSNMSMEQGYIHMIRDVTAVGEEPRAFMLTHNDEIVAPIWAPGYDELAQSNSGFLLQTSSFPNFEQMQFWNHELGYAVVEDAIWSPDQQYIAAVGGMSGVMESGLFILENEGLEFLILE